MKYFWVFFLLSCNLFSVTVDELSLDDKIAQLFIIGVHSRTCKPANSPLSDEEYEQQEVNNAKMLITNFHVGGVVFLGMRNLIEQLTLTGKLQALSRKNPLLIAQNLEWGLTMRICDGFRFPKNMTLGAIQDDHLDLISKLGKEIGRQCRIIGVHINLAPVIDVNNNPENPVINDRSFGDDPENVARKGVAFARGLQDAGIIACVKHFPGHGDTTVDSHLALPKIPHPLERLNDIELYPFNALIEAGVKAVMVGHLIVPVLDDQYPATFSRKIVTNLLREEKRFDGLIITDALDMKAIAPLYPPGERELRALLAGNDILLLPENVPAAIYCIKNAVEKTGEISEEEINRHVARILKAKENAKNLLPEKTSLITRWSIGLNRGLYEEAITFIGHRLPHKGNKFRLVELGSSGNEGDTAFRAELGTRISDEGETVIALFGMNKFIKQNFGLSEETLDCIKTENPAYIVVFGSPYSINLLRSRAPSCNIIMAYEDDEDAQIAAARVIKRELSPRGQLPIHF